LLFICVPGMHNAPGGVQGGYADIPLAALYVATAFYLLCFAREGGGDAFRLFVACATALPWMKREGSILWLIAVLAGGVLIARKRGISAALVSIVPVAALIAGWGIFLRLVHAVPSRDFFPVMSARLTNIDRLPMIAHELWLELTHVPAWDIFWVVAALSLAAALLRERTRRVAMVGWLALAPIASYCATYLFSAWPDPVAHIETSLPRLLMAPAAVALLALALALKPDLISPARPAPRPDAQSAPETDCS
jgi:hypothetical protein